MNRNKFNDAETDIEPYFLNEWLCKSDFSVCNRRPKWFSG
jgi:hypothetical protein